MLKTDRMILRAPRAADLDAMFATYSDPRAMRY
jgi:ribosomal-protein-alanine N-acetyltransferase